MVAAGGLRDWAAARLRRRSRGSGRCTRSARRGFPWTEIDFPEDYRRAVRDVLPAIEARLGTVARLRTYGASTCRAPSTGEHASIVHERFYQPSRASVRADARSRLSVSEPGAPARRSATCATASRATPASSSSPARSAPARRRCCRRCCAGSTARRRSRASMNTMLDPRELLEAVMIDLGLDPGRAEQAGDAEGVRRVPGQQRAAGRLVLLVIDEAQNLSAAGARGNPDALEPRDREVEAAADHPDRSAGPARQAGRSPSSSSCASGSPSAITCSRSTPTRPRHYINHRLARAVDRRAARVPARRDRP